jgi:hypothetical protein
MSRTACSASRAAATFCAGDDAGSRAGGLQAIVGAGGGVGARPRCGQLRLGALQLRLRFGALRPHLRRVERQQHVAGAHA